MAKGAKTAVKRWRKREGVETACTTCGAQAGHRCVNYKGQNKAPCQERVVGDAVEPDQPPVQRDLFGHGGQSHTQEGR